MNIKRIYLALAASIFMAGCSLDEKIYDTAMANSFVQKESDIPFLLNGVYSYFSVYNSYKSNLNYQILCGGDDISSASATQRLFLERTISSSNAYFTTPWLNFYLTINDANALLESMDKLESISEGFKQRIQGELCFLRGFSYFNLVRLHGGVPIHTSSVYGKSDFYPSRNTIEEVYAQVFDDLKKAAESCLPYSKQPANEFGRATKGAAQAMLALAYLTYGNYNDLKSNQGEAAKYYQLAENYADSVILSNEYSLLPNYADLWNVNNEKNAHKEVIFSIQHTRDATAASASSRGSELPYYTQPTTRNAICGNVTNGQGGGIMRIQPWFYDVCSTGDYVNDYRTEVSFLTTWQNTLTNKAYISYPRIRVTGSETVEQFPYMDKYRDPSGLQARNNENDFYIIRLSEVYLIKAEAENELNGPTPEAYAAFNKLRERARKANGTTRTTPANLAEGLTKEDFRMKIFDERGLELVGEGHRWFDSVRMKYKDNTRTMIEYRYQDFLPAMAKTAPSYNTTTKVWGGGKVQPVNIVPYTDKFLIWPIPSSEIDANPNMTQNTEYGW